MYCQLNYICGVTPASLRRALAELPKTLDGIYERNLLEIKNAHWKIAHHLFQFIAVAPRALSAKKLANLLAFDYDAAPTPEFHEKWCQEDPVDAVLSTCPSLLMAVDVGGSSVIQFSHISVRDFLTSDRLASAKDNTLRRYHVSMLSAHTLAAQACLGILLHLDMDVVTRDSLRKFPLAKYAAKHLYFHARFDGVLQKVEDGMKRLFDPRRTYLAVSVWIHTPKRSRCKRTKRTERPLPLLNSPLYHAASWGLQSIVKFLVTEHSQDVDAPSPTDGATPLHQASGNGHIHVARFLLKRGADVSAQDKVGSTPLHLASFKGQVEVVRMLIKYGADVIARTEDRQTPLHLASLQGQAEVIRMLIEHGAHVMDRDLKWETPLHLASHNGQLEVIRILIEHRADVMAKNMKGWTPLHVASHYRQIEVVRMLIEHGVDVMAKDMMRWTPLHVASQNGQVEVVRTLIEHGADVMAKDMFGWSPIHPASHAGQVQVVRMLIKHGADVMAKDKKYGETPLHTASFRGRVEVIRILIEHGADVKAKDKLGRTSLCLALDKGQEEAVHILTEHDRMARM